MSFALRNFYFAVTLLFTGCTWMSGSITRIVFDSGSGSGSVQQKVMTMTPLNPVIEVLSSVSLTITNGSISTWEFVGSNLDCSFTLKSATTATILCSSTKGSAGIKATSITGQSLSTTLTVINPLDLGPKVWLRADSLGLTDGQTVTTWTDLSGFGNDFTQGTAGFRPTFKTNISNQRSAIRFDGVDDRMTTTYVPPLINAARTFVAVVANANTSTEGGLMSYGSNASYTEFFTVFFNTATKEAPGLAQGSALGYRIGLGTRYHGQSADPVYSPTSKESILTSPQSLIISHDTTNTKVFRNGREILNQATTWNTTQVGPWWRPFTIGGYDWGSNNWAQYDLLEFFAFESALNSTDLASLNCYLSTRYNLSNETNACSAGPLLLQSSEYLALKTNTSQQIQTYGGVGGLTWTSSGSAAQVSVSGLVTAGSSTGSATITVQDDAGISTNVKVAVTDFTPSKMWLAADQIQGLTDGQAVTSWLDISGNRNHAQQMQVASRPTYRTNQINSLPVVRFAGSHCLSSSMQVQASSTGPGTTMLVVVTNLTPNLDTSILSYGVNQTWKNLNLGLGWSGGVAPANWTLFYGWDYFDSTLLASTHTNSLVLIRAKSPNEEIWVNGILQNSRSTAPAGVDTSQSTTFLIGGRETSANFMGACMGSFLTGDLAEVMVWDSWITDSDRLKVETYLKTKYAIP